MNQSVITILYGYLQFRGFKASITEATVTLNTESLPFREKQYPSENVPLVVTKQTYKVVGVAWAPKGMRTEKHIGKVVTFVGIRGEEQIVIKQPLESIGVDYVPANQDDRALNNIKISFELETGLISGDPSDKKFSVVKQLPRPTSATDQLDEILRKSHAGNDEL